MTPHMRCHFLSDIFVSSGNFPDVYTLAVETPKVVHLPHGQQGKPLLIPPTGGDDPAGQLADGNTCLLHLQGKFVVLHNGKIREAANGFENIFFDPDALITEGNAFSSTAVGKVSVTAHERTIVVKTNMKATPDCT